MRPVLIVFLGFLLTLAVAAGVFALLPACGMTAPFLGRIGFCRTPALAAAEERLQDLGTANAALHQRIATLERELGALQCTREAAAPAIDAEAWNTGDISVLEGCWSLDSPFQTTNNQTGVTSRYTSWTMCFDANGAGTEEMLADTGTTCAGAVAGAFDGAGAVSGAVDGAGALAIEEPGDLQCSDGGFIYRLVNRCALNADGTATCQVSQPEVGSSTTVSFRRAPRNN